MAEALDAKQCLYVDVSDDDMLTVPHTSSQNSTQYSQTRTGWPVH